MTSTDDPTRGSKVVLADYHRTLLKDLPEQCRRAGIREHFFFKGLSEYCKDPREIEYIAGYNGHIAAGRFGFAYMGRWRAVEDRMQAMAAALMRNYITVGMYSVKRLVELEMSGAFPNPSVMFITSDLSPTNVTGIDYRKQLVADTLSDRRVEQKQTVIRIEDPHQLESAMPTLWNFIFEAYKGISSTGVGA